MSLKFEMTNPCKMCPFRTNVKPYLTKERIDDLEDSLVHQQATFTCHETTVEIEDDEDGEMADGPNAQHCAGVLILLEKLERPNQLMRIAERIGLYDRRRLNMKAPIFKKFSDMRKAQR